MTRRLRLILVMTRPAVAWLLAVYAAIGVASAGHGEDRWLILRVLVVVLGFLVFSAACNDISDERIDAINLAGDRRKPLVAGLGNRRELLVVGLTGAVLAIGFAAWLGWPVLLTLLVGLVLSLGYSVPPVRVADRGALASLLLPACYVAVPFLVGHFAAERHLGPSDFLILAGLYITFIGRILLKDFRDVRGDALFGKRTFLVRHGRGPTCVASAICLVLGSVVLLLGVPQPSIALITGYAGGAIAATVALVVLRGDPGPRRDEAVISTIAIIGRGMLILLFLHQEIQAARWPVFRYDAIMAALIVVIVLQAHTMWRHGPTSRRSPRELEVPDEHDRDTVVGGIARGRDQLGQ
jgi:4-hydroxybenzoate polyprenyltransferase